MTPSLTRYAFSLGRESKLSLAELFALFGEEAFLSQSEDIAIFAVAKSDSDIIAIFRNIWGSVRVMRIVSETDEKKFPTDVIHAIWKPSGKYNFALWVYGGEYRLSDIWLRVKKTLQDMGVSARLVNIENKNIVSAVFKREKLGKTGSEYNLIHIDGMSYLAVTLACQDIDAYTKRDTGKNRDMVVGMMPPKLCQMMINIAISNSKLENLKTWKPITLYDPFCGLGTILIEWANMGITHIYGSDISQKMVDSTEQSLREFIKEEQMWHERIRAVGGTPAKDFSSFESEIFELDASKFDRFDTKKFHINKSIIVSEWYLGEIMQKDSITLDRVKQERAKLRNLYEGFFSGLKSVVIEANKSADTKAPETPTIVMTFPFWDIHGTVSFFTEIHDIIGRHGWEVVPLLPADMRTMMTPKGSLLYKRPAQNVGREVIKIRTRDSL